jgi:Tetratricopeptide repeat
MWYFKVANGRSAVDLQGSPNATRERSVSNPKWGTFMHLNTGKPPRRVRSVAWFPIFVSIFLRGVCACGQSPSNAKPTAQPKARASEHVGSLACAACHKQIYNNYAKTGMGRSMSLVMPEILKAQPTSGSIEDKNTGFHFDVYARDGQLFQSEYKIDSNGKEIFRDTRAVEWIIGAGENGLGGLVRQGDYVFQAPLSFYSKAQRWELSPGYELTNSGFNRPILPGCISCHSGRPNALPEGNGHFANPPFSELAIGCENCHGPGLTHVLAHQVGFENDQGHDSSIVNPASLTPALADNICMSCHQTGDVRVLKPGKDYRDFRPGMPLDDTLSILIVPPKRESPPQQDLLEHHYSMTLSKCYRASGEKLSCISCHDPHVEPTREEAPEYFKTKCLACHTEKSCTLPRQVRDRSQPADDCAGCHMQKRDVREISHSSITNHRILTRPDEPFPDIAFQQTTPVLADLIHLNPAPGKKGTPPPALVLLQAYGELVEKRPEYLTRYYAVLEQLERTDPDDPLVQGALGNRDLHAGKYQEAVEHLQRAIKEGHAKTVLYTDLAEALVKLDRASEAVEVLKQAADRDPFNPELRKRRILQLIQVKDYVNARGQMEDYVQRFPADSFMRQLLAKVQLMGQPK